VATWLLQGVLLGNLSASQHMSVTGTQYRNQFEPNSRYIGNLFRFAVFTV
jgi:hypothetical protein